jgi:two-component system alkaline phosphatase synthesis response regulator PhoP/two-component system response regulator VicR
LTDIRKGEHLPRRESVRPVEIQGGSTRETAAGGLTRLFDTPSGGMVNSQAGAESAGRGEQASPRGTRITMPKKILAVDDEKHIVRLVQVNLERQGYEVVTANDGREALEKVESERPDLVVLDVMMPYMDGFEVLQNLRRNPSTRDIPVIMLTAKAQDADVFRGWQSGVDCYLTKPFNPMELISFVKRIFKSMEDGADGGGRFDIS